MSGSASPPFETELMNELDVFLFYLSVSVGDVCVLVARIKYARHLGSAVDGAH